MKFREFFKPDTKIDFMGQRNIWITLSIIAIAISLGSLIAHGGPRYGVDFKGGTLIQVKFLKPVVIGDVRKAMAEIKLGEAEVQEFGGANEFVIRTDMISENIEGMGEKVSREFQKIFGNNSFELQRVETVGPKVGADLRRKAVLSIIYASIGILIYVAIRFELRFGVGAIIAFLHDPILILGLFSVLDKEINLTIVAAILTVIGYSVNDTIVIFDRVRDNLRMRRKEPIVDVLNASINQTLSRTLITGSTTLMTVGALFLFGGSVIHDFAFAIIIGVVVGTYSSIFIACPTVLFWTNKISPLKDRTKKG